MQTRMVRGFGPVVAALVMMAVVGFGLSAAAAPIVVTNQVEQYNGVATNTMTIADFVVAEGSDRKLVVVSAWESAGGDITNVTYGTQSFTQIIAAAGFRKNEMCYLDDPAVGTNDVVLMRDGNARSRSAVLSLQNAEPGPPDVQDTNEGTVSIDLTTRFTDTFVVGIYNENGGGVLPSNASLIQLLRGDGGSCQTHAGYTNEAVAGLKTYTWVADTNSCSIVAAGFLPALPDNAVKVVNTGSKAGKDGTNKFSTLSFDAGATADKLIVTVSAELGGGGSIVAVTYNGAPLTQAPDTAKNHFKGIWYLDNPHTGGAADIIADFSDYGVVNGIGIGAVSVSGSHVGVDVSASAGATNVTVTPTVAGSFVMAGYGVNGSSGVSAASPLTHIYGANIGSASGAAGYVNRDVLAAEQTYAFVSPDTSSLGVGAAVFKPYEPPQGTVVVIK